MEKEFFTKEDIMAQLEEFRYLRGKIVTVHTSLKAVGKIAGGGEVLLSALIEFFTQAGGLLCIPTHTWDKNVCDRREAYSCLGVLPCLALAHPDGMRTLHPTHSMVVFGERKKAEAFIADEETSDSPANPRGCYGRIFKEDGYILLIGVGQNKNTYIHFVEEALKTPGRLTEYKVERKIIHEDGREEKRFLHWFDEKIPDVSVYFNKFEEPFYHCGCIEYGCIGKAKVQICSARKIFETIEKIYKNNSFGELLGDDLPIDKRLYI